MFPLDLIILISVYMILINMVIKPQDLLGVKSSLYHQVCHIDHFVIIKISLLAERDNPHKKEKSKDKLIGLSSIEVIILLFTSLAIIIICSVISVLIVFVIIAIFSILLCYFKRHNNQGKTILLQITQKYQYF